MKWLLLIAVLTNTADTILTCNKLNNGGRELNPIAHIFIGDSCTKAVAYKSILFAPALIDNYKFRRNWLIGLSIGGGLGIVLTINLGGEK